MFEVSLIGLWVLVVSTLVFTGLTVMLVREYNQNEMRQEFGYRVWSLAASIEAGIWAGVMFGVV